jgi:hypothetical protein
MEALSTRIPSIPRERKEKGEEKARREKKDPG